MTHFSAKPHKGDPLSTSSLAVRFTQHDQYLEAALHGFINPAAASAAVHEIAEAAQRVGAERVLIDTRGVIGQLTQSDHAALGRQVAQLFATARVAAIAPSGRPVGEIAPAARSGGADYMGFRAPEEAMRWLLRD